MKTITYTEFRKNMKKYADLAETEKVVVSRGHGKAFYVVPVEAVKDTGYSKAFISEIKESEKQIAKGHSAKIKSKAGLHQFLKQL